MSPSCDGERFIRACLCAGLMTAAHLTLGQDDTWLPEALDEAVVMSDLPYTYGGIVVAHFSGEETRRGSGSIIGRNLILTAAHLIYHESLQEWASRVEFFPRFHKVRTDEREDAFVEGYSVWPEYAYYLEEGNYDAFTQLDVAILYDEQLQSDSFPSLNVLYEGQVNNLYTDRQKLVTGYPAWYPNTDFSYVEEENDLTMHRFGPHNFWIRSPPFYWPQTSLGRTYWNFINDVIPGISRNSGGPLYLLEDDGQWACAGILTRGDNRESVFRAVADDVLELIESARMSAGETFMMPVTDLNADELAGEMVLQWDDSSEHEDGYEIWIHAEWGEDSLNHTQWSFLAATSANDTYYIDTEAVPGSRRFYKVRPFQTANQAGDLNFGPFSPVVYGDVSGQNRAIASALGETALHWTTGGFTSAQVVDSQSISGHSVLLGGVDHLGSVWVETRIIGPGQLEFELETSSERNYDIFSLYLNEQLISSWSGETPSTEQSLVIGEGTHTIRWQYQKDNAATRYLDRAYLHAVRWIPALPAALDHLPGAYTSEGVDDSWHYAHWLGWHNISFFPWVYQPDFGWIYVSQSSNQAIYLYSGRAQLGWVYTNPDLFPLVYAFERSGWLELE